MEHLAGEPELAAVIFGLNISNNNKLVPPVQCDGGAVGNQSQNTMFTSILTAVALAAAPALCIPPPIFGFPDSANHTELGVNYTFNGKSTTVQEAMLFGSNSKSLRYPSLTGK